MAQAWQVAPAGFGGMGGGETGGGGEIARNEKKRNRSGSNPKQKSKSWKVGAESGEGARSGWERLLGIGWARMEKVKGRETRIRV